MSTPASTPALPPAAPEAVQPPTPLHRLVPALMASQVGNYIALLTPLQLLLTLHLTDLVGGGDATTPFGIVTGVGALVALVVNPVAGRISDRTTARFGRRRTWIITGGAGGAAALAALSVTTQVWQVVVLWCLVQALFNFQYAATTATLADQVPAEHRGGVSGLFGLATALGPLLGLVVVNGAPAGSPAQWLVIAAIAAALPVVAVALIRDRPAHRFASTRFSPRALVTTYWRAPNRYPAFGWAWAVRFLITCSFASSTYNAFFLLQRFHISTADVGKLVLTISLISIVLLAMTSVLGGYLSDRIQRQKPFVIASAVLSAVNLLILVLAPSLNAVFIAAVLGGVASGLFFAIDLALCVRVLPDADDTGKDLAIINIANSLPQSLVPFIAPVLLGLGGYTAFFLFLALLGLAGGVAVLRVPEIGQEAGGRFVVPLRRPDRIKTGTLR